MPLQIPENPCETSGFVPLNQNRLNCRCFAMFSQFSSKQKKSRTETLVNSPSPALASKLTCDQTPFRSEPLCKNDTRTQTSKVACVVRCPLSTLLSFVAYASARIDLSWIREPNTTDWTPIDYQQTA